jgi:hypothetical protein
MKINITNKQLAAVKCAFYLLNGELCKEYIAHELNSRTKLDGHYQATIKKYEEYSKALKGLILKAAPDTKIDGFVIKGES